MPATKLTLRLDERAVAQAKRYARRRGTSVSRLVERYFASLADASLADAALADATPPDALPPVTAWFASLPPRAPTEPDAYDRYREQKHR